MPGNGRFVLLKKQKVAEDNGVGTTTADWEAALNGEEGCWSLKNQVPLRLLVRR
ncbi:hypothetical protein FIBSPDRAFT_877421 [Athelia psychrophila]|uniref:Uncharacterized protein n=1 Tax=Athelia psychrophila TaxID=1759441 RepID=A0A167W028_9AGAM|nr:hypothetical protein FIBSPDRAFT_877421 [Fibularhizoctonia sp. CBS 109695]